MNIDPDQLKIDATNNVLNAKFQNQDDAAERRQRQLDSLAKAREAKKQKQEQDKSTVKEAPQKLVSPLPIPILHDDLIWREAMVAIISSGRIVSPKQLPDAASIADAYLSMVKSKFNK